MKKTLPLLALYLVSIIIFTGCQPSLAKKIKQLEEATIPPECDPTQGGQYCSSDCLDDIEFAHNIGPDLFDDWTTLTATPFVISAEGLSKMVGNCENRRIKVWTENGKVQVASEDGLPHAGCTCYSSALIHGILRKRRGIFGGRPNQFTFYEADRLGGHDYTFRVGFALSGGENYYDVSDLPVIMLEKIKKQYNLQ